MPFSLLTREVYGEKFHSSGLINSNFIQFATLLCRTANTRTFILFIFYILSRALSLFLPDIILCSTFIHLNDRNTGKISLLLQWTRAQLLVPSRSTSSTPRDRYENKYDFNGRFEERKKASSFSRILKQLKTSF
jgi:hypothetical protein